MALRTCKRKWRIHVKKLVAYYTILRHVGACPYQCGSTLCVPMDAGEHQRCYIVTVLHYVHVCAIIDEFQ